MYNILSSPFSPSVSIFIFLLTVALSILFIVLLYFGIKNDRKRYMEEKMNGSDIKKVEFDNILKKRFNNANKRTAFSLFYIEINDAKSLKDSFGDSQYRNAIQVVVKRLESVCPLSAKVCHYAYDTIVVLISNNMDKEEASQLASLMIMECSKPVSLVANFSIEFSVNIGVANYNLFNSTKEQMWENLKLSLVSSKRSGVNQFVIHNSDMNTEDSEEYKFYQEIKDAIENNEFTLYYQPIFDLKQNKIFGYESLLRWNHKTLGVLSPNKFLNILEQSGDINWVGFWAFEQLLIQHITWSSRHPDRRIVLSMNLSPKQLINEKLVDDLKTITRKYKVSPSDICFEIVEFAMFDKMSVVKGNIAKLKQAGYMIAIDNYGLGESSFSLLEQTKIDMIKLSKNFISKASDNSLTTDVINMLVSYSERSDIKIVAENIENDDVLNFVKGFGIEYGQGYLFGIPLPPSELEKD